MIMKYIIGGIATVLVLLLLWVSITISIKRLRDANVSAWWYLLVLIPYLGAFIIFIMNAFLPSVEEGNKYCKSKNNLSDETVLKLYIALLTPIAIVVLAIVVPKFLNKNVESKTNTEIVIKDKKQKEIVTVNNEVSEVQVNEWKYKEWKIEKINSNLLLYVTNGQVAHGNEFGFLKATDNCLPNRLYLRIASTDKRIINFKGKFIIFEVVVDEVKFKIETKISEVHPLTSILNIVEFSSFHANDKFTNLLRKGHKITFTINAPNEIVNSFDIPYETFSLNGFTANYLKAFEACEGKSAISNINLKKKLIKPNLKKSQQIITQSIDACKSFKVKNLNTSSNEKYSVIHKICEDKIKEGMTPKSILVIKSNKNSFIYKPKDSYSYITGFEFIDNENIIIRQSTSTYSTSSILKLKSSEEIDLGGGHVEVLNAGKYKGYLLKKGLKSYLYDRDGGPLGAYWYNVVVNIDNKKISFIDSVNASTCVSVEKLIGEQDTSYLEQSLDECVYIDR